MLPVVLDSACAAVAAVHLALQLIHPSGLAQNFGLANLHPDDWFKPFDTGLTSNHV